VRVVVIGAGLGGLSAACHLAGREHDVTVVERAAIPGGRAGVIEAGGYRMDTGPCVMTMPGLLRDVFAAAGADMDDHVTLRPVDPMYRAVYPDGSSLRVRHGREAMTEEIRAVCGPDEAAAFGPFCDWLAELYRLEMPDFIDRNFDSPLDYMTRLGTLVRIIRMGGLRSVHRKVASFFAD
jgi:phytoene desaturase